jgi:hypothetical protein
MFENLICRPEPVLQNQPTQDFALVFHLGFPQIHPAMVCKAPCELNDISRLGRVVSISCETPPDLIRSVC